MWLNVSTKSDPDSKIDNLANVTLNKRPLLRVHHQFNMNSSTVALATCKTIRMGECLNDMINNDVHKNKTKQIFLDVYSFNIASFAIWVSIHCSFFFIML